MNPDFWIEINRRDETQVHLPFLGTRAQGEERIRHLIAVDRHQFIDFVILLRGNYIPGQIARVDQILADAQSYPVQGAKRCQ